jgi:hypothetical protein
VQVCADLLHMVVEGVQVFPRLVRMGEEVVQVCPDPVCE